MNSLQHKLVELGACGDAVEWALAFDDLEAAWNACPRGDWLLWLVARTAGPVSSPSYRRLTAAKAVCAWLALPFWEKAYADDRRPRRAIEEAEAYAHYEGGAADIEAAACAAFDAAKVAADAAQQVIRSQPATVECDTQVAACHAAAAAGHAAFPYAEADENAYVANAVASVHRDTAAYNDMLRQCAEAVRQIIPTAPSLA